MNLSTLQNTTSSLHDEIVGLQSRCDLLTTQIDGQRAIRDEYKSRQSIFRQASILVGRAADDAREGIRQRFESTVTAALRAVFDSSYAFHIEVTQHANATSADFYISSAENREPQNPLDTRGGSVVDICAIALRLAYLDEMGADGPVIMDEPTKHVSAVYRAACAEMLLKLQAMTGRQVVVITHDTTLSDYAHKTVEL
jgi:ABC-type dipeptide/oligopeptide/nickel transport system ATPase component